MEVSQAPHSQGMFADRDILLHVEWGAGITERGRVSGVVADTVCMCVCVCVGVEGEGEGGA